MSKRQPVIHHQARWYGYGGLSWGVSDCYCTSYSVQMNANWNQVTCKNCLKRRPREESANPGAGAYSAAEENP